jgi:hypothetical protein
MKPPEGREEPHLAVKCPVLDALPVVSYQRQAVMLKAMPQVSSNRDENPKGAPSSFVLQPAVVVGDAIPIAVVQLSLE